MVVVAAYKTSERDPVDHLRSNAGNLGDPRSRPCRSQTYPRPTAAGAVRLVALAINLTVPPAVVLLEMDAAAKCKQITSDQPKPNPSWKD